MPSSSKPSPTQDSLPTSGTTTESPESQTCTICAWLGKLQDGAQKEMLKHMGKFHPPKA